MRGDHTLSKDQNTAWVLGEVLPFAYKGVYCLSFTWSVLLKPCFLTFSHDGAFGTNQQYKGIQNSFSVIMS